MFNYIISGIVALVVSVGSFFIAPHQTIVQNPVIQETVFGADATLPLAGVVYSLSGSGVSGSATTIVLTSLTIPQTGYEVLDADLSATFYITLEPGSRTRQEIVSCTTVVQGAGTTATLSGCTRGLLPYSPFTASSTYQFAHGGGTAVVFSNPPQLYNQFAGKDNDETITGFWTFPSSTASWPRAVATTSLSSASKTLFASLDYVDSVATSGAADANLTTKGLVEIATKLELANGSTTGDTTASLVPIAPYFNQTSSATTTVVVTRSDGKIEPGFLPNADAITRNATTTFASTTILNGTTTASGTVTLATTTIQATLTLQSSTPTGVNEAARKDYVDSVTYFTATSTQTVTAVGAAGAGKVMRQLQIPAMGVSDVLEVTAQVVTAGNSSTSIEVASTTFLKFSTDSISGVIRIQIKNRGLTNSQISDGQQNAATFVTLSGTSAVQTNAAFTLNLVMYDADGSGNVTVEYFTAKLLKSN